MVVGLQTPLVGGIFFPPLSFLLCLSEIVLLSISIGALVGTSHRGGSKSILSSVQYTILLRVKIWLWQPFRFCLHSGYVALGCPL